MKKRIATVYLRLMKYAMFMGVFGGIATLIGRLAMVWLKPA